MRSSKLLMRLAVPIIFIVAAYASAAGVLGLLHLKDSASARQRMTAQGDVYPRHHDSDKKVTSGLLSLNRGFGVEGWWPQGPRGS